MMKTLWNILRLERSLVSLLAGLIWMLIGNSYAEDLPLTPNVPIDQFQNRHKDFKPYNFDAAPQRIFRTIQVAEGFDEECGFRRQVEIIPVNPTREFLSTNKPVGIMRFSVVAPNAPSASGSR
jgi:hypothetical protein